MVDESAAVDAGASDGDEVETAAETATGAEANAKTVVAETAKGTVEGGDKTTEVEKTTSEPADKGELQTLREMLAGGDDGLLKALERYKSVDAISKAFREARQAAKSAKGPLRLSEKATEEEVASYREAVGIPPEPENYPVAFREDYKPTDADNEVLGEFKTAMHERNVDPAAAAAALDWYQDFAQAQQQALDGHMAAIAKQTQTELRAEWGGEFDGNIGAVREFMTAQLGQDGFERMMGMRLMDGSRLQDDPAFVKMMAQVATDYYGSNAIFNGDIETTSKTVQERIDELLKLRTSNEEEYFGDKVQGELAKLYAQKEKINARKG